MEKGLETQTKDLQMYFLHTISVYNKKAAIAYNDTDNNRSFDFDQKISYIRISTA